MDEDDIKKIMYFLILIALWAFGCGWFMRDGRAEQTINYLQQTGNSMFVKTRLEGNLFIKDNELAQKDMTYENLADSIIAAYITGYNTLENQTDDTPCLAASGDNICGRTNVVACPRYIPLGTLIKIDGRIYHCLDRTNEKYDGRFDICFDKDIEAAKEWGIKYKEVTILN